jgi:hypothetical protein
MQMVGSGLYGSCCTSNVDNDRVLQIYVKKSNRVGEVGAESLLVVMRLGQVRL